MPNGSRKSLKAEKFTSGISIIKESITTANLNLQGKPVLYPLLKEVA